MIPLCPPTAPTARPHEHVCAPRGDVLECRCGLRLVRVPHVPWSRYGFAPGALAEAAHKARTSCR